MKLLVAMAFVGLMGPGVAKEEFVAPIELDYHNAIGIPTAARIKAAEEALDFSDTKIVGGIEASFGQFPFFGGLIITLTTGLFSFCGSTLVSNTRVVTAAHCVRYKQSQAIQFTVVLGSTRLYSGGTRVTTSDVETHANYNMKTLANDVAIIRFEWVTFTDNIYNIALASGTNQFVGTWAWAAGFGRTSDGSDGDYPEFLSHVQVQVISNAECQLTYGSIVRASNLCVATYGGHGTCSGDSGGPLVDDHQLIGITSFGFGKDCERGYPTGFSRVTAFTSWIQARL